MNEKRFMILAKNLIFLLFFIALIGIISATTYNCTNCTNCNNVINSASSGDIIQLNTSVSNHNGTCIDFNGTDDITFNCLGNYIEGNGTGNYYGIYLSDVDGGSDNTTIKNCSVTNFTRGFYLDTGPDNTLLNVISNNNSQYGIYFDLSSNNILTNVTSNSNTNEGIYFWGSSNNILTNVTSNSNSHGIHSSTGSDNNTFTNIITNLNTYGVYLGGGSSHTLTNITSNDNSQQGIYLASSSNNNLTNITANSNNHGIFFGSTSNNNLTNITANSNNYGILIQYSSNNILKNSNMSNNNYNFRIEGNSNTHHNNDIDTSNIVDYFYKIYYNYSISDYVFDLTTAPDAGIIICAVCDNVTVKDFNLSHHNYCGMYFFNTTNSGIENITSSSNNYFGITLSYSNNNTLQNITSNSNNYDGIYLASSSNNTLQDITSNSNSDSRGIWLSSSSNNSFQNITSNSNWDGIYVSASSNNLFQDITSNLNHDRGIFIHVNSDNNTLQNVTSNLNSWGIYLSSNSNNTFTNITSNLNTQYGIYLSESSNNTFTNITSNLNTQYGIYLSESSNNTLTNITTTSNNRGIYFFIDSNNNTLTNITSNSNVYGIYLNSGGNVFKNNNMSNNTYNLRVPGTTTDYNDIDTSNIVDYSYKIYYNHSISNYVFNSTTAPEAGMVICSSCDNVTYKDLNLSHYNYRGLYFFNTSNSYIYNITSSSNAVGIECDLSSNNILQDITTNFNDWGILLDYMGSLYSNNNTLINITANLNQYGIFISASSNNTLNNITTDLNSDIGIWIDTASDNNTLTGSYIRNNTNYGLYFRHLSSDYPEYNIVYNNFFNNTVNYYNSTNLTNYFNTTLNCSSGENIIEGSCMGGNYWGYPNGTGFSDTCTDSDSNGICDLNYSLDGSNYDYWPLVYCTESWTYSAWSTCSGGTQTRTATDANDCGTTNDRLALSQSCTSESGGGGGIVEGEPTDTHIWTEITADEPVTMTITEPEIHLTEITFTTTETVTGVSLTVTEIDVTPQSDIQISADGTNYQGFKIDTSGINDTNIANVIIDFKVNKTWLQELNFTYDDVTLYKKPDIANIWDALNTSFVNEDSQYYYFSAISPGFSTFVIFVGARACNLGDIRCFDDELQLCVGDYTWIVTEKCKAGCEDNKCIKGSKIIDINTGSLLVYTIIVILSAGILVVLYFVFRFLSKKHQQNVWEESQMMTK